MTAKKLVLLITLCCNAFSLISQEKSDDSISATQTADQAIESQGEQTESAVNIISQDNTQQLEGTGSETEAVSKEPSDISTENVPIIKETEPDNTTADANTSAKKTEIEGISENSQDASIIQPSTPDVEAVATPEESIPEEIEPEEAEDAPEEESTQEAVDTPPPTLTPNTQESVTPEVSPPEATESLPTPEAEDQTTQKAPATNEPTEIEKKPSPKIEQIKPIALEPIIIKHYPAYKGPMLFLDSSMIV